ncbi:MAG: protein translocase SEC61 complex subunit gamma [Candidatus Aenigmarchaeota archaeon]|nr:protein translocase SEC61 complex subunit gamma [Candidatus Aenigmarchaeota archaeon]
MRINIKETLTKYKRVLLVARKPDADELKETARICGIGSIVIGIIGFIFYVISVIFGGA